MCISTSNERLYLSRDKKQIVTEGDPRADIVACEAGGFFPPEILAVFLPNLVPGVSLPEHEESK